MAKRMRSAPEQDSDYDGAWKDALRAEFRLFLWVYFPETAASIDWNVEVEWLDKEISQIVPRVGQRGRSVDLLAKVRLLNGQEQWILVHVEVQTAKEIGFEERAARYNWGLSVAFPLPVKTLLILADLDWDWMPSEYRRDLGDFQSYVRFPTWKFVRELAGPWRDSTSLPVQIARAQVEALRTASDPRGRFHSKRQLVRNLYTMGYNREELRKTFRWIDWIMRLRLDFEVQFLEELSNFEKEQKMAYVTSVERLIIEKAKAEAEREGKEEGKKEGKREGKREGKAEIVIKQLNKLCGVASKELASAIRALSVRQLDALSLDMLSFESAEDLEDWLNRRKRNKS